MRFSRRQAKTHAMIRLPLVALIDVVLFLLIYFLIAGDLSAQEEALLAAALKTESAAGSAGSLQPQVLRVEPGPNGALFKIGERTMPDVASVISVLSQLPKHGGVLVRVNGRASVEAAAAAVQACKDAGFTKVSYVPAS